MSEIANHVEKHGVIPMGPGYSVSGACSCGWHSHSKTFAEHIAEVEARG